MAKLSDDVKTFIVQHLAMYDTPTEVLTAVKESFGIDVSRDQVQLYDPTIGRDVPGKRWVALFQSTRERFLSETSEVPIAQRAVRLRWLDQMARSLKGKKNFPAAAQMMEQAAKEVGDIYTNRRELTGKNGVPLMPDLTDEERRERVVGLLREASHRRELARRDEAPGTQRPKAAKKKAVKEPAST